MIRCSDSGPQNFSVQTLGGPLRSVPQAVTTAPRHALRHACRERCIEYMALGGSPVVHARGGVGWM